MRFSGPKNAFKAQFKAESNPYFIYSEPLATAKAKKYALVDSTVPRREKLIAHTFGRNRSDALYLLPIHAAVRNRKILVDFTMNRFGFEIHEFERGGPDGLGAWHEWPVSETRPSAKVLEDFIRREFPCFLEK